MQESIQNFAVFAKSAMKSTLCAQKFFKKSQKRQFFEKSAISICY